MDTVLQTPRCTLRKIKWKHYEALCKLLGDPEVMYAWEYAFSREEVEEWIEENHCRYEQDGYSYYVVEPKTGGDLLGVCGLIKEQVDGQEHLGVGYIFHTHAWGKGYATESAAACIDYAFQQMKAAVVTAQIRPENTASRQVAQRLGMEPHGEFVKTVHGVEMPHILYKKYNEQK